MKEMNVARFGRGGWLADKIAYNSATYLLHAHGGMDYCAIAVADGVGTSTGEMIGRLQAAGGKVADTPAR